MKRSCLRLVIVMTCAWCAQAGTALAAEPAASSGDATQPARVFRAGAAAVDVSPTKLPVIVNGNFFPTNATRVVDPLHARAMALNDGETTIVLCVVDSCLIPRDLANQMRSLAEKASGVPASRIMVSATHTHSAPSLMPAHGSDADPDYPQFLVVKVVEAIRRAVENLAPAEIGWTVVDDTQHTYCRQWIFRPDRVGVDPFGEKTVRSNMHPGHQNPNCIAPEGPTDPALSLLAVRAVGGAPIAIFANYSMHYFGAPAVSADYFGHFAAKLEKRAQTQETDRPIVGIMSQGTSGDLMWLDFGQPAAKLAIEAYAEGVAQVAYGAYSTIQYQAWAPLAASQRELHLKMRVPDEKRLVWAREVVGKTKDGKPSTLPEIYAREQLYLHEHPERDITLQAFRIGELGIAALPCEVFGITGLKIKAQSPLATTFNIELANGEEGYIPPPELHKLGGYTTWACRTAGLETTAEPKIVDAVLGLLEEISERPRRAVVDAHGAYAQTILAAHPLAYWRLNEWSGPRAIDATGHENSARYEDGVAFYLEGPQSTAFSGDKQINRSPHFAGGRLLASAKPLDAKQPGGVYSVEFWFWNGLPHDAREVSGYLFARGPSGSESATGDQLAIGGTQAAQGKLIFSTGNAGGAVLSGQTTLQLKTWNHIVLVREGKQVKVYLNGATTPEIAGESDAGISSADAQLYFAGRADHAATLEGKLDEVSVYDRALSAAEAAAHYQAAALR